MFNINNMDFAKITVMYDTHKNVLSRGLYNISDIPNEIILHPQTRLQIFDLPQMSGNNVIVDNAGKTMKIVDAHKLVNSNIISCIKSLNVMSNVCDETRCGLALHRPELHEPFDDKDVKNVCHYMCSLLNIQNIIFGVIFFILLYYLLSYFNTSDTPLQSSQPSQSSQPNDMGDFARFNF